MRSRAVSFPCLCWRSILSAPPPSRRRASSSRSSAVSSRRRVPLPEEAGAASDFIHDPTPALRAAHRGARSDRLLMEISELEFDLKISQTDERKQRGSRRDCARAAARRHARRPHFITYFASALTTASAFAASGAPSTMRTLLPFISISTLPSPVAQRRRFGVASSAEGSTL